METHLLRELIVSAKLRRNFRYLILSGVRFATVNLASEIVFRRASVSDSENTGINYLLSYRALISQYL